MATGGGEVNSDEIITIKCCFCVKNNRTREAAKYCVECKEYYCSPCTDTHRMFPTLAGHKLLDKTDFRSLGSDGDLLSVPTQRCSQHHTEVINMYCKDHDEVSCPPCIALNHRTCKDILFIPEQVDNLYNKTELTDVKQKLHKSKTTMQEIKSANENKIKELKRKFDKEVHSIKAFRQELQTLLDNLEQETIKELKTEFDRIETQLSSEIHEAENLLDSIDEVSSELNKSEGNKAQVFVSTKTAKKVSAKAEEGVKKAQLRKTKNYMYISFSANRNIEAFLWQHKALGNFDSKSILDKVKQRREIQVKLAGDRLESTIKGICIVEDGSLLLADHNNKKLKRLDIFTETVKDYIDLQSEPYAVCLISKTEAVVTQGYRTVQFVSLQNKLSATRKLTMNHPCYGLAHTDGKLFISDKSQTVFIHDMNGKELKKISRSTNHLGKIIFVQAANIKVSADGNRVFVADGKNGLVILDIQGNILTTVNDLSLARSWGVCTDGKNLFVLGHDSGNIVQIGQDYKSLGKLEGFQNGYSLCFDCERCRLYVTLRRTNKITVLELE